MNIPRFFDTINKIFSTHKIDMSFYIIQNYLTSECDLSSIQIKHKMFKISTLYFLFVNNDLFLANARKWMDKFCTEKTEKQM